MILTVAEHIKVFMDADEQNDGTDVSLSGMSGPTPSFRSPNVMQEVLIFELTVTDRGGNVGTDSVSVDTTVVFLEPTADAGADQSEL